MSVRYQYNNIFQIPHISKGTANVWSQVFCKGGWGAKPFEVFQNPFPCFVL